MNQSLTSIEPLPAMRRLWRKLVVGLGLLVAALAVLPAQAQSAIVGSGLWNTAVTFPACSYTEFGTLNVSYVNGVYSATYNASNGLEDDCTVSGPWSCSETGYMSPQDLLSESQFRAALDDLMLSCSPPATALSANFASADSVSGIGDYGGLAFSYQMTRQVSTSYTLGIAKSGSGTVTGSAGGINCGATCSANLAAGTSVTLTATPAPGNFFYGWNGDCSGTGVCLVTMDAAKSVTARFKPVPFAVAASGVSGGLITAPIATVTTTITFNAPDVGKSGSVFVTAWAPYGGLSTFGISVLSPTALRVTSTLDDPSLAAAAKRVRVTQQTLAATDPNSFVLVQLTSSGWQLVVDGQLVPYASGVLGDQLAAQTLLDNTNTANLLGTQFCLGYGASATEMIAAERIQLVATVPNPNPTAAAQGSCAVDLVPAVDCVEIAVHRYRNTAILGHFYTTNTAEGDALIAGGSPLQYEGVAFNACSGGSTASGVFPVYRFRHRIQAGVYFYSMLPPEIDSVRVNLSTLLQDEGVVYHAFNGPASGRFPVYRFRNAAVAGANFYTIVESEKTTIITNVPGYPYEGIGFYGMPPR